MQPPAADPFAPGAGHAPRPADRLRSAAEVVLMSGYPTQFAIGLLLIGAGLDVRLPGGDLSLRYVVALWSLDAAAILALAVALSHARHEPLTTWLFGRRPAWREVWLGLAMAPVVFGLVVAGLAAVGALMPGLHNVPVNPFEQMIQSRWDAAALGAVAVVSGGFKEEVQRAFVLRRFEADLGGPWVGLVIFSLAFGAGHFLQGWDVGVVTTLLGLFWGVVYLKRRSIVAPAISHAGFNVAQIVQFLVFGS